MRVGQRLPDSNTRVALLLHDGLDEQARHELEAWVEGGGTLVLADPDSPMAPSQSAFAGSGHIQRDTCDIPALDDVSDLDVPFGLCVQRCRPEHSVLFRPRRVGVRLASTVPCHAEQS